MGGLKKRTSNYCGKSYQYLKVQFPEKHTLSDLELKKIHYYILVCIYWRVRVSLPKISSRRLFSTVLQIVLFGQRLAYCRKELPSSEKLLSVEDVKSIENIT